MVEEDVDDTEDQSLIELAGDMLEEILEDIRCAERVEFPVVLFFTAVFNGVLCIEPEGGGLMVLSPTFLLAAATGDLPERSDEMLPQLSLREDLVDSVLVDFDEPWEQDFKDDAGFGDSRWAPLMIAPFDACGPLLAAVQLPQSCSDLKEK